MSSIEQKVLERSGIGQITHRHLSIGEWIAAIGVDLTFLLGMVVALVAALLADGGKIRWFQESLLLPVGIMLASLIVRLKRCHTNKFHEVREVVRDWFPFIMIDFIYENLRDLTGILVDFDIAPMLYKMDVMMFGGEPTVWAGALYHPLLVDIMAIFYALYFAFPLVLMFVLSIYQKRWAFRSIAIALSVTFVLGFIGYIVTPASPPRFYITEFNPPVLHGLFLFDRLQSAWDGLSVITGGAFPSLHVGISTVALIYSFLWRKRSRLFKILWYIYLPGVVALWASTVYLRHHWFVDIIAGWAVALAGFYLAEKSVEWWRCKLRV